MPGSNDFGGGAAETVLHPIVLVVMLVTILLILVLPRKYVIVPFLLCIFLVPLGQEIYLGGNHWFVYRIIVMVGLLRLLMAKLTSRGNIIAGGFNSVDWAFLGCALCEACATVLRFRTGPAVVNQFGFLLDYLGAYFLLRWFIQNDQDIHRAIKCFALLAMILGIEMVREQFTLQNLFGLLGGVKLIPEVREGRIRSQGVFQHSLTAGVLGATFVPLFLVLWKKGKSTWMAAAGLVGSTAMTITSNSSTPLLAYAGGLFAVSLWFVRKKMRVLRWAIVFALVGLNVVMKAPVWFLIARIDLISGSGGYHRAELVDQFIRHVGDWWLLGSNDMTNWGIDMWDVQNQFVQIGETGGLVAFVLFIVIVSRCFGRLGYARKFTENVTEEWGLWFFGATLFASCVGFFGVNYFDQSKVGWFTLLAMISAVTAPILKAHPIRERREETLPSGSHFAHSFPNPALRRVNNESHQRALKPDISLRAGVLKFRDRT